MPGNVRRPAEEAVRRALGVYLIMGSPNCPPGTDPAELLADAIDGGVTCFQYREKGPGSLAGDGMLALGKRLQAVCRARGVPFIVNDDAGLAAALGADGIHVGQDDEPASSIRARLGAGMIVGVSAHTADEARRALADGADYLGIGPVFPTGSKPDAKAPQGTRLLEELRAAGIAAPLVGIGGITPANAASVLAAGADGVSVISAIALAPSPSEAARRLAEAAARAGRG
ncbi:thiamine-phosphate pyrophosphorylase [Paenibacillus sp. UNC496MF]|nr:thiamine-phosphate pyrophosphorylase [Paenibacillus sp. UNC496MF]